MKSRNPYLLLLLTLVLLLIFACLPRLVAALQDYGALSEPGTGDLHPIQLDLNREQASLPVMGKLALLSKMESMDIDPSRLSMTAEDAFAAAYTQMGEYEAAGIFGWFDFTHQSAVPKIGIDQSDPGDYILYWTVTFTNKHFPHQGLVMDIDDETGKILSIQFSIYDTYSMDGVWERNKTVLDAFAGIYFSQLGLAGAAEKARTVDGGYEYFECDGGVSYAHYAFSDLRYGEIHMEFYVEGAGGFYVYFPE